MARRISAYVPETSPPPWSDRHLPLLLPGPRSQDPRDSTRLSVGFVPRRVFRTRDTSGDTRVRENYHIRPVLLLSEGASRYINLD